MNLDLAHKVGGRSNESPLTPLGKRQASALGAALSIELRSHAEAEKISCYSSTAVRTRETASLVISRLGWVSSGRCLLPPVAWGVAKGNKCMSSNVQDLTPQFVSYTCLSLRFQDAYL